MSSEHIDLFEMIQSKILSDKFKEKFRTHPKAFTRRRKLDFPTMIGSMLNRMSKSLAVEINQFLYKFGWKKNLTVSKQSYSEARHKLKYEAFIDLNDTLIRGYYQKSGHQLYQDKYLLLATDGTNYRLPNEEELIEEFDQMDNGQSQAVLAKGVKIYDVLNRLTIRSRLSDYRTAEEKNFDACWPHVLELIDPSSQQILLLGDRHYPSFRRFIELDNQGVDFLFRCKSDFCNEVKAFAAGEEEDAILKIDLTKKWRPQGLKKQGVTNPPDELKVRIIRIPLEDKADIFLLTSVLDQQELTTTQLQELYPYRWEEETSFDFDKNRMEIENFSSKTVEGIKQDFFAAQLTINLTELIIMDAQEQLDQQQEQSQNKYKYQINRSVALGLMKDQVPNFFLAKEAPDRFYLRMRDLFLRFKEPIRPGRTYPRERKYHLKYSMNLRRVT